MARCEKARNLMEERGIDCLLLASRSNCFYFSGYSKPSEYYKTYMLLPRDGSPVLAMLRGQLGNAEETSWLFPDNIRTWGNGDALGGDPIKLLLKIIREMGLTDKVIAAELTRHPIDMSMADAEALKSGLSKAKFVDAREIIWKMRMIKSSEEIKLIRKSCEINCKVFKAGLESVREGITEKEVANVMFEVMAREGVSPRGVGIVMRSGSERYLMKDGIPQDRKLKKGDFISVDGGCTYKGYASDIMRQAVVGTPSEEQAKRYKVALQAVDAAVDALKPGAKVKDVVSCAMDVIKKAGYAKNVMRGVDACWMGHGMGLEVHEPPDFVPTNETRFEAGMVVAVEPSIWPIEAINYYRGPIDWRKPAGEGTFVVEDNWLITPKGHELLSPLERDLWVAE